MATAIAMQGVIALGIEVVISIIIVVVQVVVIVTHRIISSNIFKIDAK